jgi:ribosomal protein S18 acetylase RimI-like enzyme
MTIRQAEAALRQATNMDRARIADIFLASRAAFLPYARSPHSADAVRAWVRDILLPSENVTVASIEDRLVGFMATLQHDNISWITQLYLDPSHVGQGIGSCLLTRALETMPRPIRLHTFFQNTGARRFYERHGFSPILFTDGYANEERCPDVLYELAG